MAGREIILASQSPRRRELLSKMGYEFICDAADVDEHVQGQAREIVGILARRKAHAVLARHKTGVIIASDTLVSLDGAPLGKPGDEAEAVRMLRARSGREHEVFSGVCLLNAATGREQTRVVRTGVTFRQLSEEEIRDYVATGEPMDKAGAYGIQGLFAAYVSGIEGDYNNVVGLPVGRLYQEVKAIADVDLRTL